MDLGPIKPEFDEDEQRYPDSPQYGPPGTGVPPGYTQEFRQVPPAPAPYAHHPYPWLGGGPPPMAAQSNVTNVNLYGPRRVNHALHGTLTLLTCGMWAPVWAWVAITARR